MSVEHQPSRIVLSNEQRERFDRDGYLILESPEFPPAALDGVVSDLEDLYAAEERVEDGVLYAWHRIMQAWKINENVKALALAPNILALLEELYGRKPLPFQTLNFRVGTQQPVHADTLHFNSIPAGYMCGVWVALEDMDMENGPLVYYPGSHKLPEITLQDVGEEADELQYTEFIAEMIERKGLRPEYATIRKGQAFLWAANILHGGSAQKDMSRTRLSQVTHYYFEGCRYWTPLHSTASHTQWRHPEWIVDGEGDRVEDGSHEAVRELVSSAVPAGATVLVASRGDDELLELDGKTGWHFPRGEDGSWSGYYPADSAEAIAHLERLRALGAEYLLFPNTALWWLEHYGGLREHLEDRYRVVAREESGAIYDLGEAEAGGSSE
jgi:hypothetical protein